MLAAYVDFTNDTTILERALGLADQEFNWWTTNRTLSVVSPYTNTSYDVARYDGAFLSRRCSTRRQSLTLPVPLLSLRRSLRQHRPPP